MIRRNWLRGFLAGLLALSLLILTALSRPAVARAPAPSQVCVLLLLDNSKSMAGNDPTNLRFTAAKLFVALLDEGDSVGIMRFSTESHPLSDGLVTIRSTAGKRDLVRRLEPAAAEGWTDVKAAFADAQTMLDQVDVAGCKTVAVFLTDGEPEISSPYPEYEDEALVLARSLGVPIWAIALTPDAQTPFLNRLVTETGGTVVPADDATDLLDAYLEAFGQIKDRTVLRPEASALPQVAPLRIEPALASYVETASFIISKTELVTARLIGPGGREVQPGDPGVTFSLTEDPRFAVLTVADPPGGVWGFRLEGEGNVEARAILRSRVRVEVVAPGRFHEAGQPMPIVVHLIEERPDGQAVKIIGEASFSAVITCPDGHQESLDRFYDDGTHGDIRAGDGDFTRLYVNTDEPGTYTIAVQGWKGVVPVERTARAEAIPFPEIVVDEPTGGQYDIRSRPVPLQVHLAGGTPPLLDQGTMVARVTAPSGPGQEVVMKSDTSTRLSTSGGVYRGAFLPTEDGVHEVEFAVRDAAYKGLAYTHTTQTRFEARIIPTITIGSVPVDLGAVEMADAQQGVAVTVPVSSTGRRAETLSVRLDGMPGFALADAGPLTVPAGRETELTLHLTALPEASLGPVEGRLVFAAREGVDLEGAAVPVRVRLFRPTLRVSPNPLDLGSRAICGGWSGNTAVTFKSTSLRPETVRLGLRGVEGLSLEPATVEAAPGTSQVTLDIAPADELAVGEYEAWLLIEGRDGLQIEPGPAVPVHFRVAPVWVRCRRTLAGGGVLLGLMLAGVVVTARRVREAMRPPAVTGTLRHWPKGQMEAAEDIDLTAVEQTAIAIGRGEGCDFVIPDLSLTEEHLRLRAEEVAGEVRMMLEPLGEVRMGYRVIRVAIPLRHGDTFTMGTREFQYLSDEGEWSEQGSRGAEVKGLSC